MECPKCHSTDSRVTDSRSWNGSVRRRRECNACGFRFSTEEVIINFREPKL